MNVQEVSSALDAVLSEDAQRDAKAEESKAAAPHDESRSTLLTPTEAPTNDYARNRSTEV